MAFGKNGSYIETPCGLENTNLSKQACGRPVDIGPAYPSLSARAREGVFFKKTEANVW